MWNILKILTLRLCNGAEKQAFLGMRCWLVQAKPMTSSGLSRLGQRAVGSGPGEVTFLLNTPPLLLSHLVLRTTPPGRKQDRPSPVKVTKPFMLTRKSGKGRRHAYLLYLLWKAYLKLSEEVQDCARKKWNPLWIWKDIWFTLRSFYISEKNDKRTGNQLLFFFFLIQRNHRPVWSIYLTIQIFTMSI